MLPGAVVDQPVRTDPSAVREAVEEVFAHPDDAESLPPIAAPQSAIINLDSGPTEIFLLYFR